MQRTSVQVRAIPRGRLRRHWSLEVFVIAEAAWHHRQDWHIPRGRSYTSSYIWLHNILQHTWIPDTNDASSPFRLPVATARRSTFNSAFSTAWRMSHWTCYQSLRPTDRGDVPQCEYCSPSRPTHAWDCPPSQGY